MNPSPNYPQHGRQSGSPAAGLSKCLSHINAHQDAMQAFLASFAHQDEFLEQQKIPRDPIVLGATPDRLRILDRSLYRAEAASPDADDAWGRYFELPATVTYKAVHLALTQDALPFLVSMHLQVWMAGSLLSDGILPTTAIFQEIQTHLIQDEDVIRGMVLQAQALIDSSPEGIGLSDSVAASGGKVNNPTHTHQPCFAAKP